MKTASLNRNIEFKENKPSIQLLFETNVSKEIRIAMKAGQVMSEHKTPFPIVVELFEGNVAFGVQGKTLHLCKGDLISLDGNVPHDLRAASDCIIRLTLSKLDKLERVKAVDNN